jgi:hypothetical protein
MVGAPVCSLVNPRPQQADLVRRELVSFADGRHLHVLDGIGGIVDEEALGAVAGNDVICIFAAAGQRRSTVVESEMTFWFFRPVAAEAGVLENRLDVPGEIDRLIGRRWQRIFLSLVHGRKAANHRHYEKEPGARGGFSFRKVFHLIARFRSISQSGVHIRAVDGGVAARGPACAHLEEGRVVRVANVNVASGNRRALHLRVAAEAKIGITFDEHFLVNGAVRTVAGDATFTQRVVLEDKWPCLISMALGAILIPPRHGQPAGRFHDVHSMRVVALDAVHAAFQDRVVLGKMELSLYLHVALKTSSRVVAGIDDESFAAAQAGRGDMFAAGTVA